jgi:hypothetical protein
VHLDETHAALAGRSGDGVLDAMIFGRAHGIIRTVWVRGRKMVSEGRHRHRDAAAARFAASINRLLCD